MKPFRPGLLIALLVAVIACEDDPAKPIPEALPAYKNLTQRADVLYNLEVSYNKRNLGKYDELMDGSFTFFLSTGDVGGGLPASWDRATEVTIHTGLFDPNYGGPGPRCTSIDLDIQFENGVTWAEIDAPTVPAEKWYVATLFCDFQFDVVPNTHWINNPGNRAQFTVRNAGSEDAPKWQLVEMHDIGDPEFAAGSSSATVQSTWGNVKAMYRDGPVYKSLSQRSDVLYNLELSYNQRNLGRYDELLDDNLTFFPSTGDVGGGLPASWDRATEVTIHTGLFNPNYSGSAPRCRSIDLDIMFESGVTWIEIVPSSAPAETWYVATVFYDFKFEMDPDMTYVPNPGARAQFSVRNAGTGDAPQWRLVEMRDLGDPEFVAGSSSSTEQSTWGRVKAMYR